jgi:hypothetical protein
MPFLDNFLNEVKDDLLILIIKGAYGLIKDN